MNAAMGAARRLPGWVFVTLFLSLCILAAGLTHWNYSRRVFSSARGVTLEPQWPEPRIAVEFVPGSAARIRPGSSARVTLENRPGSLKGEVVSVVTGKSAVTVVVRLLGAPPSRDPSGRTGGRWLPAGERCSVTIDTTVPPESTDRPGQP
jgi:hypothetical protein